MRNRRRANKVESVLYKFRETHCPFFFSVVFSCLLHVGLETIGHRPQKVCSDNSISLFSASFHFVLVSDYPKSSTLFFFHHRNKFLPLEFNRCVNTDK